MCWPTWVLCLSSWKDWHWLVSGFGFLTWSVRVAGFPTPQPFLLTDSLALTQCIWVQAWAVPAVDPFGIPDLSFFLLAYCFSLLHSASHPFWTGFQFPIMPYFCDGLFVSPPSPCNDPGAPQGSSSLWSWPLNNGVSCHQKFCILWNLWHLSIMGCTIILCTLKKMLIDLWDSFFLTLIVGYILISEVLNFRKYSLGALFIGNWFSPPSLSFLLSSLCHSQ